MFKGNYFPLNFFSFSFPSFSPYFLFLLIFFYFFILSLFSFGLLLLSFLFLLLSFSFLVSFPSYTAAHLFPLLHPLLFFKSRGGNGSKTSSNPLSSLASLGWSNPCGFSVVWWRASWKSRLGGVEGEIKEQVGYLSFRKKV